MKLEVPLILKERTLFEKGLKDRTYGRKTTSSRG